MPVKISFGFSSVMPQPVIRAVFERFRRQCLASAFAGFLDGVPAAAAALVNVPHYADSRANSAAPPCLMTLLIALSLAFFISFSASL